MSATDRYTRLKLLQLEQRMLDCELALSLSDIQRGMLVLAYDGATLDEGKLDQVGRWRSGLFARICSSFGLDPVEVSFHLGPIGQIPPSERHIRGPHDDELLA